MMGDIQKNIAAVNREIISAAEAVGRAPEEITLIAVSKIHPQSAVLDALRAGQRVFGENRVQEAAEKYPALREEFPDLELHLIGPLQTNKVRDAVRLFDVIQTVDRPRLADVLIKEADRIGRPIPIMVQVNTGEESQKAGVVPLEADSIIDTCKEAEGLDLRGLMCIPPIAEEPAMHFALLQKIAAGHGLRVLSMGMSADYSTAIQLGATHVRIGTAIFGQRPLH